MYLKAATISGSLVKTSGCPTLLSLRQKQNSTALSLQSHRVKIYLKGENWPKGQPPWETTATSASSPKTETNSLTTGGVTKSVWRNSFLDVARLAYNQPPQENEIEIERERLQKGIQKRANIISRMCLTSLAIAWSPQLLWGEALTSPTLLLQRDIFPKLQFFFGGLHQDYNFWLNLSN